MGDSTESTTEMLARNCSRPGFGKRLEGFDCQPFNSLLKKFQALEIPRERDQTKGSQNSIDGEFTGTLLIREGYQAGCGCSSLFNATGNLWWSGAEAVGDRG